ncbi:MAG: Uma2 family endonuclease [Isosphaeraceae bacterium]
MATATVSCTPDSVLSFRIRPGTLAQLLQSRAEAGPRLICVEGSVTLVSPGRPHEWMRHRLHDLIGVVCTELGIRRRALGSTTWALPPGSGDTAYEADEAYLVGHTGEGQPEATPDLAVEVVVTHPASKALRAGEILKIPELWVLDLNRNTLTFYRLATRGKAAGRYREVSKSRAFPFLSSAEVLERLNDPGADDTAFLRACGEWARRTLAPRFRD